MSDRVWLLSVAVLAVVVNSASAQVPAGRPIATTSAKELKPLARKEVAEIRVVNDKSVRVEVKERPERPYAVQLRSRIGQKIEKGDVLLLKFEMRALATRSESGEAMLTAVFERSAEPYTKSLDQRCAAAKQWMAFSLPFVAKESYEADGAHLTFHLGHEMQTLEISGVGLLHYGKAVKVTDLPRTRFSYAGREPDAAWRKEALERIERIRKADLSIRVHDAGKPVANAVVEVRMIRHAFAFGSAVTAEAIMGTGADNERYRAQVKRLFNRVVFENDLKWPSWESPNGNQVNVTRAINWLRDQRIDIRGHVLIWPGWRYLPRDIRNHRSDPAALRTILNDHITEEVTALRGVIAEWDVINEPYSNRDLQAVLGEREMVEWFKLARAADPMPRLFLNDYPMLTGRPDGHMDHFEKTIRFLIDNGAPIGGIGVQGHYGSSPQAPAQLLAGLDRLAKFRLPIVFTEFDVNSEDEQLQADYLRDHFIACFSHEAVEGILMWGFWEGRHWLPAAALYRRDWSAKPNAKSYEDLVLNRWWTKASLKTDERGVAKVRGFLGDYEIAINGEPQTLKLGRDGASLAVQLP